VVSFPNEIDFRNEHASEKESCMNASSVVKIFENHGDHTQTPHGSQPRCSDQYDEKSHTAAEFHGDGPLMVVVFEVIPLGQIDIKGKCGTEDEFHVNPIKCKLLS
jgi:hypothetical protein